MSDEIPPDVRDLDRALRAVRFAPRASLGAEIDGRRRREQTVGAGATAFDWRRFGFVAGGAAVLAAGFLTVWYSGRFTGRSAPVTVDQCCYDLDGGGKADDGLHVVAGRGEQVYRVAIYEDLDGSVSFTPNDLVRYKSP